MNAWQVKPGCLHVRRCCCCFHHRQAFPFLLDLSRKLSANLNSNSSPLHHKSHGLFVSETWGFSFWLKGFIRAIFAVTLSYL